jgi:hypothetical protein
MSPENCRPQTVLPDAVIEEISVIGKDLVFEDVDSPTSENAWIRIHSHSLTRTLQNWSNSVHTTRKKKFRLKERGVSQRKFW